MEKKDFNMFIKTVRGLKLSGHKIPLILQIYCGVISELYQDNLHLKSSHLRNYYYDDSIVC